jgi:glycosyltransferase involved in cell wall biosynthesis
MLAGTIENGLNSPQVSVIMSVKNGEKQLEKAILSVFSQTYTDFEFIIMDDASTDRTSELLSEVHDPRVRLLKNATNLGLTRSLNRAARIARGKFIARMDADDICLPRRFEEQVNFLESHPGHAVVGCSYSIIDDEDRVVRTLDLPERHQDITADLQTKNVIAHGTVMIRKKVFDELEGYDETFTYAQDYEFWLRLIERYKAANLKEVLYHWRQSRNSISWINRGEQAGFAELARERARSRKNRESGS